MSKPTRTEIIEAGARAEWERLPPLPGKPLRTWDNTCEDERDYFRGFAEAALVAMLPLIKAQLEAEVLSESLKGWDERFAIGLDHAARIIEEYEPAP